ncbi:MAG: response regulator [Saprospiraceae bacterium]|nr:response regulator [Saprospiraceae bacterium]MCF8251648.1 response regulator [Saprospiraceae bacterium]MCF8281058.1 response regulator [Bacteroidales bacterium]MCF8313267.1 response regulator [Saprospiraceae bacterium]MCF8442011.1 response regulator [Saprospiraceae bacterium]
MADSLIRLVPEAKEDSSKVDLLCTIAYYLYNKKPKESLEYSEQCLQLASQLKYGPGIWNAHYKKGLARISLGEYDIATEEVTEGLKLAEQFGLKKGIRSCYNVLGIIYRLKGNTESALEYAMKYMDLCFEMNDSLDLGHAYNNLGVIYLDKHDNVNARKYFLEALDLYDKLQLASGILDVLTNLGIVEPDSTKRQEYILKSIKMGLEQNNPFALCYAHSNQANFLWEQCHQPNAALPEYQQAISLAMQTENYLLLANLHSEIGSLFGELKQLDSAQYHLNLGVKLAEEQGLKEAMLRAYDNLTDYYASHENYYGAFTVLKKRKELSDSLYNLNMADALANADAKFETSKKEAQLTAQKLEIEQQKNQRTNILIGGILLLALTAGVFQYFFYRQKQKKQQVELALQAELMEAERLRNLDELKTQFFTNVSHELRTPLTLIISPLEEVLKKLKQVNLEADLQLAHRNSKNLLGLVNEVLDLSKMEVGKLEVEDTEVALASLLRRVLFSFQSAADLKDVSLDYQFDLPAGAMAKTDVGKLEKVLNNLISNALKFTPKGGQVKLSGDLVTIENLSTLHLSVTDTGQGIHPDDLPHVFDRFFQGKKSPATPGGTGIGLALSKQLAKLLGGDLTLQSEIGKGSRFDLSLPCELVAIGKLPADPIPTEMVSGQPQEAATGGYKPFFLDGKKPRLLIVEDNPEMGDYLKNALSQNYDCSIAADGESALQYLQNCQLPTELPDLITSDVMMPNMDGFTLREKINERPEWQKIPFILLTARTLEADKLKGFQLGIDDYVTKPFSLPELEARVSSLLKNKQLRDEMAEEDAENIDNLPSLNPDEVLLKEAEKMVLEKLDDPNFTVETLAKQLGHSQRQLARILGRSAGLPPVQFILELRLQRARQLLENRQFSTVNEVRYEIGIASASYSTRKFAERFGKNPSDYNE